MAWIARTERGFLNIYENRPEKRENGLWKPEPYDSWFINLPTDADEKLIGRHISWDDEPVEI